jgi:hypothetical protein
MLRNHWRPLTPVFALLILGLVGVGCDSSGLSGPAERGADGQSTTNQGPGPAGPPGNTPGGPPSNAPGSGGAVDVRVAHLSPDAPAVDIFVGNEPNGTPAIGGLEYRDFAPDTTNTSDYLELASGTYDVTVTAADAPSVVAIDTSFTLAPNTDYTVLAVGELTPEESGEPAIQALPLVDNGEDDPAFPPRDKTLVRFVHASPDAGTVDIAVDDGPTLLEDIKFGDASGYLEIAPGDYDIDVGPGALEVDFEAVAGTKVTAYVIGNATTDGEDDAGLSAVTSLEATNPAGSGALPGDGDDDEEDDDDDDEEDEEDDDDEEDEDDDDDEEEEDEDDD